jgi:hypothetical protein
MSELTRLLTTLPGQFLALVLLNTAFVLGLLWFLDREQAHETALEAQLAAARERILVPVLQACVEAKAASLPSQIKTPSP